MRTAAKQGIVLDIILRLTNFTLQYNNSTISYLLFLFLQHESSTSEDADFLPGTGRFNFCLLARYHVCTHQVYI